MGKANWSVAGSAILSEVVILVLQVQNIYTCSQRFRTRVQRRTDSGCFPYTSWIFRSEGDFFVKRCRRRGIDGGE